MGSLTFSPHVCEIRTYTHRLIAHTYVPTCTSKPHDHTSIHGGGDEMDRVDCPHMYVCSCISSNYCTAVCPTEKRKIPVKIDPQMQLPLTCNSVMCGCCLLMVKGVTQGQPWFFWSTADLASEGEFKRGREISTHSRTYFSAYVVLHTLYTYSCG